MLVIIICLVLLLCAWSTARAGPVIRTHNFWVDRIDDRLMSFFKTVLPCEELTKDVDLYSVFPVASPQRRDGRVTVQWSGENRHQNDDGAFDLSLVMAPTDIRKGVVCMTFFALECHLLGCWEALSVPRPIRPAEKSEFCIFIASNGSCEARNEMFKKLSAYKHVHSAGPLFYNLGNTYAPRGTAPNKSPTFVDHAYLRKYKFMICFENSSSPYYLTEKLLNAYLGGTVPIYWGADKASEWFNPDAFFHLQQDTEAAMDAMVARIIAADNDDALYERMLRQPLFGRGGVPEELSIRCTRDQARRALRLRRPDAF
jgi:hypothetical protein